MNNTITNTQVTIDDITDSVSEQSAFQRISVRRPLNINTNSYAIGVVGGVYARWDDSSLSVGPEMVEKLSSVTLITADLDKVINVTELLGGEAPRGLAKEFDASVMSGSIGNLNDAQEVTASTWGEVETHTLSIPHASHLVVSSVTYDKLRSLARAEGAEWDGTALDVRIVSIPSARDFAVFGDFKGYSKWGAEARDPEHFVRRCDAGFVDMDGQRYNLTVDGLIAYITDVYYGFKVDVDNFRKLTITEV